MECKACGAWFSSSEKSDLCPACERAMKRLKINLPYDRLIYLILADNDGRVKIDPKAGLCPKCGKHSVFPRIDFHYFYCYSCKTQFAENEYKELLGGKQDGN